jgi:hypothetical protein
MQLLPKQLYKNLEHFQVVENSQKRNIHDKCNSLFHNVFNAFLVQLYLSSSTCKFNP